MPTLCDANVLMALCYEDHTHHAAALAWLGNQGPQSVAMCRATQATLLRLLTTPTVMGADVRTLAQAWEIYDAILEDDRFLLVSEPSGIETAWRSYTRRNFVSPKVWQDAYLAAFAVSAGMELATFDRGFQQFAGLSLTVL